MTGNRGPRGPKPGALCVVCNHRERAAIELGLARGVSMSALARRYGPSPDSLYRHRKEHMPPQLKASLLAGPDCDLDLDRLKATESQSLLANLVAVRHRLFAALDMAEEMTDGFLLTRVTSQLHTNLELTGKLLGELGIGHTNVTNILIMPQYVEMRTELVRALRPFPEAAQAVAAVLHAIETKAAADIAATDAGRKLATGKVPALIEAKAEKVES
jgi:transposase-like protein